MGSESQSIPHGTRAGSRNHGCRCVECREWRRADQARFKSEYKARNGISYKQATGRKRTPAPCDYCGEQVIGWKVARPLHAKCKNLAVSRRRRHVRARRELERAAAGIAANPRWPFVNGECSWCGEEFTRRGTASGYCSKSCSSKAKRRWITKRDRRAIYERDGWACQICMDPVEPEATDEWRATIDHIVPRSHGGSDDPANLRLAHLWCNSVRGDLSHYSDEDLRIA